MSPALEAAWIASAKAAATGSEFWSSFGFGGRRSPLTAAIGTTFDMATPLFPAGIGGWPACPSGSSPVSRSNPPLTSLHRSDDRLQDVRILDSIRLGPIAQHQAMPERGKHHVANVLHVRGRVAPDRRPRLRT